jgi:transcriptional regulator with XRE-family HTH domain
MGIKALFGANVKDYRKRKGFSQEELSEKLAISPNHLSKIERGRAFVSAELLERLVSALDVPAQALFSSAADAAAGEESAAASSRPCRRLSGDAAALFEHIVTQELRRTTEIITRRMRTELT